MKNEWIQDIDDIKIICKSCMRIMVMESSLNNQNAIYSCNKCGKRVNMKVNK